MKKFLLRVSVIAALLSGLSPAFLILGLGANDLQKFFHDWFVFVLTTFTVFLVSSVAMQLVDD